MEETLELASQKVVLMKGAEESGKDSNAVKVTNGNFGQEKIEGKKQDEDITSDGEFIKVDKETIQVKRSSPVSRTALEAENEPSVIQRSTSDSSMGRELLEAQEKVKELELELEMVAGGLKQSESENSWLKNEISLTKDKLEDSVNKYEELELNHRKLKEKIVETEERYHERLITFQEALQTEELNHNELINVKETFDNFSLELENSRKKIQELEEDLKTSAGEAQNFEELHKQSGSRAESEMKRASEFERLLELARLSAKEMEDQIASLQEELKGLHKKIAENQKVEEAFKCTAAELSTVQGYLELSKSKVSEMEQIVTSKEAFIKELTHELDLIKVSESQVKEDMSSLQKFLSTNKEDFQVKMSELEELKLKLQEEMLAKEKAEVGFKDHQIQFSKIQEELANMIKEKEYLEAALADMATNAAQMKEFCDDLDMKLQLSNDNFCKTDSLLSQASANSAELEQKLKTLEELHHESGYALTTANKKNLELEEMLCTTNEVAEAAKSHHAELEKRVVAAEERSLELEEQLSLMEQKSSNAERELIEFSEKMLELNARLDKSLNAKQQLDTQVQEYQDMITQLESELCKSSARNSELELELKTVAKKSYEHEERANMSHSRGLELEDLLQLSHSKGEETGKRASELELFLETEKYRIRELEEHISLLDKKCGDMEAESRKHLDRISELEAELAAFETKASTLEVVLKRANEKEKELIECLNITTEEKRNLENSSKSSSEKLSEANNILEALQNELNISQQKMKTIESDLKASGMREEEVTEKLKSAEEQLEQERKMIEQTIARKSELESLHESLIKDYDLKFQELITKLNSRDSEAKSLHEKLETLEDQVNIYEKQIAEAGKKSASVKEELDQILVKLASSEFTNEEFKRQMMEAEGKAAQTLSENEFLVETNTNLKIKLNELQEMLDSACAEKVAISEQLSTHVHTITKLTEQQSRASELQEKTESRISDAEKQLQEAIQKLVERDSEAKELNEKLYALQVQIKTYEEQTHEASSIAKSQKLELNLTLEKVQDLENVIEELQKRSNQFEKESERLTQNNLKLTQELATYESRLNHLQVKLSSVSAEKDEAVEHLLLSNLLSKKEIENLTQQLTSEEKRKQLQLSSVMEEKNMLNETYLNAKKELQSVIIQLEEQVKTLKSNEEALKSQLEALKSEIGQTSVLQDSMKELEEQLATAKSSFNHKVETIQLAATERERELTSKFENHVLQVHDREILSEQVTQLQRELIAAQSTIDEQQKQEADSRKVVEQESSLKHLMDELEAKNKEITLLENKTKELKQKLLLADSKSKEKDAGCSPSEVTDETEVKTREIGYTVSTPSKQKSKKKMEVSSTQAPSAVRAHTQATEVSPISTFKFVLGVALVSVLIGIILGKRY